jgi:hypothetical protein
MAMRRLVAIAISVAALASPAGLWAQRGGGHASSGGAHSFGGGHSFSGGFSGFHSAPAPVYRPGPGYLRYPSVRLGYGRPGPVGGGRRPGGGPYVYRGFGGYPYYGYTYPYAYGYYIPSPFSYVGFPSDYQSDQAAAEAEAEGAPGYAPPGEGYYPPPDYGPGYGPEGGQEAEGYPPYGGPGYPAQPPAAAPEALLPTVLVYRDGHQMEVQNYAIYGQNVWVFGDQITRKIALAELDLPGTKKLNDQRGVEFDIPESR